MMMEIRKSLIIVVAACGLLNACGRSPVHTVQLGYRGTGEQQVYKEPAHAALLARNVAPEPLPQVTAEPGGPTAGSTFKNVQVLKELSVPEFARLMAAMTTWVAPQQGCTYCHSGADLSSDALYTKVVARRMLQMTMHINSTWKHHVGNTGVTCFSCHRGNNVPANIWFTDLGPSHASATAGNKAGQNAPAASVRLSALPNDPFTTFLDHPTEVRVVSKVALRNDGMGASIQQTEQTYGLMMHITQALGVNCTFCHNSRSFFDWDQSTPQRATAWYGIRMVRDLNVNYLEPLNPHFPANRKGPGGDSPKLNCTTCHQGVSKPLNGASMLKYYSELANTP
jgi:photosynthetic reaction center cytochrome c subunit